MAGPTSDIDVAVIGAGAAGLAAARHLGENGVSCVLLEASHRIGGRAYTEELGAGQPFDLGCHWMHSASLNPFPRIADELGISYTKDGFARRLFLGNRWASPAEEEDSSRFFDESYSAFESAAKAGRDIALFEAMDRESRWAPLFDYYVSLITSRDSDQASTSDLAAYTDTQEDWPLREGYGTLLSRYHAAMPVTLNAPVSQIDWTGTALHVSSPKGNLRARRAIVAVSTGALAGGDIRFTPALPDWKEDAIHRLPLGNHNRIGLQLDRNIFGDFPAPHAVVVPDDDMPMGFEICPFGFSYVVGSTGGRFADWLERAGIEASVDLAKEMLAKAFGSDALKHIVGHNVTAWRGDPWTRGAYSIAEPGQAHQRAKLAEPLDERLFFAGEATHASMYSTAHGAHMSGIDAANAVMASLKSQAA